MSTLVFSDTHFTKKFRPKQFEALKKLILASDRIIINGDFWEGLAISFDDFLQSDWNKLFPLLKQKETIYIYGNHDHRIYSDNRVYQFCTKAVDEYYLDTPNQKYLFKHGHEFLFPKHSNSCIIKNKAEAKTIRRKLRLAVASVIQDIGFGLFGPKAIPGVINSIPADLQATIRQSKYLLVSGHTHRPGKYPRSNFVDAGFFSHGWANYLIIDEAGEFKMISKRY